ncbi:unnamed protein product [Discula destructiva]
MADSAATPQPPPPSPTTTTPSPQIPKTKYERRHERRQARHAKHQARREARRNDDPDERKSRAGDTVGHVSNGLKLLTCGVRNPVSGIVGSVADGLKRGAGEEPNRDELERV